VDCIHANATGGYVANYVVVTVLDNCIPFVVLSNQSVWARVKVLKVKIHHKCMSVIWQPVSAHLMYMFNFLRLLLPLTFGFCPKETASVLFTINAQKFCRDNSCWSETIALLEWHLDLLVGKHWQPSHWLGVFEQEYRVIHSFHNAVQLCKPFWE